MHGPLLEEKTKPIEPIEVKRLFFKKMHLILTNRTHWNYLSCFLGARAKIRPDLREFRMARTRILSEGSAPQPAHA